MTRMLSGVWKMISGFFIGLFQVFNIPYYFKQFGEYIGSFTWLDWILSILAFLLVYAIWAALIYVIYLLVRKYLRFRRSMSGSEDILEELASLHRDINRLTKEKERILALKIGADTAFTAEDVAKLIRVSDEELDDMARDQSEQTKNEGGSNVPSTTEAKPAVNMEAKRFFRLSSVDDKYDYYISPVYREDISLFQLCTEFRNFACSKMGLYYESKTIRLMFAGLSSTKMILLQGISGTGKTSLPYALGKFFQNDATIASVQPSWRDRSELFGYFNEFTKKFNETEVLRRIYESGYNDDVNIIVLDEMNIARVEYYFAEMLSVLEMPDQSEWKLELVPSSWPSDPKKLEDGKLIIPPNVWYVGTANNDDTTFAVSDKVYDRAFVINLDSKGQAFVAPETPSTKVSYSHIESLYRQAMTEHPVSKQYLDDIQMLDMYVIQKFRVAFGNRIMKQLNMFVPVYVACGGTELEGIDYMLVTKVFRKFEDQNLSLIRDEIKGLIQFLDRTFGKDEMKECIKYLQRLQKTY